MAQPVERAPRLSPGDATGKEKARLARENSTEVRDRRSQISVENAVMAEEAEHGVFDPRSGQRINGMDPAMTAHTAVMDPPEEDEDEPAPRFGAQRWESEERVFTGRESAEEMDLELSSRRAPRPKTRVAYSHRVRVRTNCDIDRMTYGVLNNEPQEFNFKEGLSYDISRDMFEHMDERGLIASVVAI